MNDSVKELIRSIYECQKRIIITRRLIRDMEAEGMDTEKQREEILGWEKEISKFQKILRKKYQFNY